MLKKLIAYRTARALLLGFLALLLLLLDSSQLRAEPTKPNAEPTKPSAEPTKSIDYDQLTKEATDLLSQNIQINTTNPPGNEIAVARLLKEKFRADVASAD